MMQFENLIISGCSFSAGASDIQNAVGDPTTWSHFLLSKINPSRFVNLAMPAGGNIAAGHNIVYLLENKKSFAANNTLVIFNITGLDRLDTVCFKDHPYATPYFQFSEDFEFGWITEGGFASGVNAPFKGMLQKNMGLPQIITINSLAIINTISYLEANNFQYAFMLMDQQIKWCSPDFLKKFLDARSDRFITFNGISDMHNYCKENRCLKNDNFHPNKEGHRAIADFVYQHVNKY